MPEYTVIIKPSDNNNDSHDPITPITTSTTTDLKTNPANDMAFAMPRSGRPKTLEGKYHIFTARLREDLFEYAQSITGKDKEYQSVNDLINRLIAKEMLSEMGGKK